MMIKYTILSDKEMKQIKGGGGFFSTVGKYAGIGAAYLSKGFLALSEGNQTGKIISKKKRWQIYW